MKTFNRDYDRPSFQGDLVIFRVPKAPEGVKPLGTQIVAHSETGHHHVAQGATVLGGLDPMVMFLKANGDFIDIVHERSWDTHETVRFLTVPGDVLKINRQREGTRELWRRTDD